MQIPQKVNALSYFTPLHVGMRGGAGCLEEVGGPGGLGGGAEAMIDMNCAPQRNLGILSLQVKRPQNTERKTPAMAHWRGVFC